MSLSLHDVTIPTFRQTLGAIAALVDKAEAFCAERGLAPQQLIQARLAEDMLPFAYQVKAVAVHSLGAIEAVRLGRFSPDMVPPPDTFAALRARVGEALKGLEAIDPAEVNGFLGRDMYVAIRDRRIDFTAENFLLSFSLPNFFFHATTAYDILRWKGLQIGKRDFMGQLRVKS